MRFPTHCWYQKNFVANFEFPIYYNTFENDKELMRNLKEKVLRPCLVNFIIIDQHGVPTHSQSPLVSIMIYLLAPSFGKKIVILPASALSPGVRRHREKPKLHNTKKCIQEIVSFSLIFYRYWRKIDFWKDVLWWKRIQRTGYSRRIQIIWLMENYVWIKRSILGS